VGVIITERTCARGEILCAQHGSVQYSYNLGASLTSSASSRGSSHDEPPFPSSNWAVGIVVSAEVSSKSRRGRHLRLACTDTDRVYRSRSSMSPRIVVLTSRRSDNHQRFNELTRAIAPWSDHAVPTVWDTAICVDRWTVHSEIYPLPLVVSFKLYWILWCQGTRKPLGTPARRKHEAERRAMISAVIEVSKRRDMYWWGRHDSDQDRRCCAWRNVGLTVLLRALAPRSRDDRTRIIIATRGPWTWLLRHCRARTGELPIRLVTYRRVSD
jgi:hypothetical protein